MAGLLHDVGRLVMLVQFTDQTDLLLQRRSGDSDQTDVLTDQRSDDDRGIELEREQFGFDHAQVGGALLELWGLPEAMVQAAHQHADEIEPDDPGAASVWRANMIAHEMIDGFDDDDEQPWMAAIGLANEGRKRILDEIAALENDRG